jgi:hypothetical protein
MSHRVLSGATVTLDTHSGSIKKNFLLLLLIMTYASRHIEYVLPFPDTFSSSGILPTKVGFILNAGKFTTFAYTEELQC